MWLAILAVALVLTAVGIVYLISRFGRFAVVRRLAGSRRFVRILLGAVPVAALAVYGVFDIVNMVIILLHLAAFWLIADLATGLFSILRKRKADAAPVSEATDEEAPRPYVKGIIVLVACAVYLAVGRYNAFHVDRTEYRLETAKILPDGQLRILLIADSHVGTTFDADGLAEHLAEAMRNNPDIVIVAGDFIDDGTTREDMIAACRVLGTITPKYGVYFAYGNHDKGYYNSRGYTAQEFAAELAANGVRVLEDEAVLVADTFYVIGRMDKSDSSRSQAQNAGGGGRKSIAELTAGLEQSRFMIDVNHQPNDYAAEAAAGVDLVLSGHTHGGQLIPLGPIGRLMGANDRTYGIETRGETTFIVTSGISDWEIHYKTGTKSEYVIVDIRQK